MADVATTRRAWLGRIDAERSCLYYQTMSEKYRRRYRVTSAIIGFGSIATGSTSPWADVPWWISMGLGLMTGAAVVALLVWNDARTVAQMEGARDYFAMMARDWRDVWDKPDDPNERWVIRMLEERMWASPPVNVDIDHATNEKCHDTAVQVLLHEYVENNATAG